MKTSLVTVCILVAFFSVQKVRTQDIFSRPPVDYKTAEKRSNSILNALTTEEKIKLIGGYSRFFIQSIPDKGIPYVFMTDATQGVRLDKNIKDTTIIKKLGKTTAFPCPIMLSSTWNPELAKQYASCVGEECRAAGADYLLGPGINIYRISQCGRNFEYFGEDPFLTSRMIEKYVVGIQSTGTIATLKHFVCNNTDFYRRRSNSVVDERTLNEIYLPAFKAGIKAGAMAVMTSYNKLNGEWCGQSKDVITNILRKQLGFKWLVMTDWTSVYDGRKVIQSGQDIEMPELVAMKNAKELLDSGKVAMADIDSMVKKILITNIAMGFFDRPLQDTMQRINYTQHEQVALNVAREGIVLLKNEGKILPVHKTESMKIVALGKYMNKLAHGGGAAYVVGYNNHTLAEELKDEFGKNIEFVDSSSEPEIAAADLVILSTGTYDSEGSDRPFDLPQNDLQLIERVLSLNDKVIIVVNSGGGVNMSPWIEKVPAVIYAWYGGQIGNKAVCEVISGKLNPSGKLPISIERRFEDSPGYGYLPADEKLYSGRTTDQFTHKEYDIIYKEGIFVGYRWYEHQNKKPLFAFGYGLSYSSFEYGNIKVAPKNFTLNDTVEVSFTIKNTSDREGSEISELYVQDPDCKFARPIKELKGFKKVSLKPGEIKTVQLILTASDFSYWNPEKKQWIADSGKFNILIGSSSDHILLNKSIVME